MPRGDMIEQRVAQRPRARGGEKPREQSLLAHDMSAERDAQVRAERIALARRRLLRQPIGLVFEPIAQLVERGVIGDESDHVDLVDDMPTRGAYGMIQVRHLRLRHRTLRAYSRSPSPTPITSGSMLVATRLTSAPVVSRALVSMSIYLTSRLAKTWLVMSKSSPA